MEQMFCSLQVCLLLSNFESTCISKGDVGIHLHAEPARLVENTWCDNATTCE